MAALRLLRAPAWQHCCSRPCWTPAPSPGRLCTINEVEAFNVLAALAMGGLGVSGLEPACGLPYPTPAVLLTR